MNRIQTENSSEPSLHWMWWLFYFCVFTAGFWVIDHTPFASDYYKINSLEAETDNRTADRIESVNLITAPVRIVLGICGGLFLLLPNRQKLRWGGIVTMLMVGYLFYTGASTFWSVHPRVSAAKFAVLLFFSLASFGLAKQLNMRELATLFVTVCLAYIFIGIVAELVLGNFTPHKKDYRFVGTCHPNTLAVYGSFCCLVSLVYFNKIPNMNRVFIILFLVGISALVMSKSRTTLAGFGLASLATIVLTFKPNHRVLAISTTMLLLVLMGLSLTLSRSNVRAAAAEKLAMGRTKDVSTLTGRLPLWEVLLESVEEKPLIGHGYLAYWDKERIEILSDLLKWEIPHGHNMYIDVLLDGGIIGLLLFASIIVAGLLATGFRSIYYFDHDALLVFGFLTFAVIHGFAESLFKLPTFLLFMLVTLLLRIGFQTPENMFDGKN
ncbi:MAG: O-antigen ligase family protein [Planctomycetota bacterium]